MSKVSEFKDWCGKAEIIRTGDGSWRVRINGCDVFDWINEFGCKQHRSFDIAQKLATREEAVEILRDWLQSQLDKLPPPPAEGE